MGLIWINKMQKVYRKRILLVKAQVSQFVIT